MTLDDLLTEQEEELLNEYHKTRGDEYDRYWHHFTPEEKEQYVKEGHKPKSGIWIIKHREVLGLDYHDKRVVHHQDHDKHNNKKKNLKIVSRSEHAIIDPNARKCWKCKKKGCGNEHYAFGLCFKHYMHYYRKHQLPSQQKKKEED